MLFYYFTFTYYQRIILFSFSKTTMSIKNIPRGVRRVKGRQGLYYIASIQVKGKRIHLYSGRSFEEALIARKLAEETYK